MSSDYDYSDESASPDEPLEYEFKQLFGQKSPRGRRPGADASCLPGENRQYEPQHLWERHHKMKRLAVLGFSNKEIAAQCGCTPQTVCNILNSAMMKREIELMRGALDGETLDVAKEINRMHAKSLVVLEEILDDRDAPIALRARVAMDNLSRGGYSPQINVKGTIEHHFTAEEIERIKADAISAGASLPDVIDVSYAERDEGGVEDGGS